jgi:iron complex transport system substrate-binding protein
MKERIRMKKVNNIRNINKVSKRIALLLVMIFVLASCGKATSTDDTYATDSVTNETNAENAELESGYPYTFVDKFGKEVTIESKPESIVSFAPEITESIFALNAGDRLVGRSSYCDYPEEALAVADLGSLFEFSAEKVIEVNPDLVFLSSMVGEEVYQQLVDNNIKVVVFDHDVNLQGTMEQIKEIGRILDQNEEATLINENIQNAIQDISEKAKTREAKSVYFAVSVGEFTSAATGDTFINDMIVTTGAENTAADGTDWTYSIEELVEKNPDIIICSNKYDTKLSIQTLDGYKDLTAVKEDRLYEVDENIFFRQGPRVAEALYVLDSIIYGTN